MDTKTAREIAELADHAARFATTSAGMKSALRAIRAKAWQALGEQVRFRPDENTREEKGA